MAALETIKVYLTITPKHLIRELFDAAVSRLSNDENEFLKESLFDPVRLLTQFADTERVKTLFDKFTPYLEDKQHQKDQKKTYR